MYAFAQALGNDIALLKTTFGYSQRYARLNSAFC